MKLCNEKRLPAVVKSTLPNISDLLVYSVSKSDSLYFQKRHFSAANTSRLGFASVFLQALGRQNVPSVELLVRVFQAIEPLLQLLAGAAYAEHHMTWKKK